MGDRPLTTEGIFVEVEQKPGVFPSASPVVDHFLAALLGSPAGFTAHGLAAARAAFFKGGASKLLVEARFAAALTARGYATTPAAAHELQLCVPSHVAGTARAAEAIAALTKVGLVCRKLWRVRSACARLSSPIPSHAPGSASFGHIRSKSLRSSSAFDAGRSPRSARRGFGGGSENLFASEAEPPLVLGLDRHEIVNLGARRAAPPPPAVVVALVSRGWRTRTTAAASSLVSLRRQLLLLLVLASLLAALLLAARASFLFSFFCTHSCLVAGAGLCTAKASRICA